MFQISASICSRSRRIDHIGVVVGGERRNEEFPQIKKSLAQEVRQKSDVSEQGRFVPFNTYFVCNTAIGSLCDLYGVTLSKKLT